MTSDDVSGRSEEQAGDGGLAIGEVARRTGLRPSAIRYYERLGLLPAPERVGGRRRYRGEVVAQLEIIALAQAMGLTLAETRTLIRGFPPGTLPAERWTELARAKLSDIDEQIRRLEAMRALLDEALSCQCSSLEECVALARKSKQRAG